MTYDRLFAGITFVVCTCAHPAAAQWVESAGIEGGCTYAMHSDGTSFYAGGVRSLFRSDNGTATWNRAMYGLYTGMSATCFSQHGTSLFLGTASDGVWKTVDRGATWSEANDGLPTYAYISSMVSVASTVYCSPDGDFYASTDDGATWTQRGTGLPPNGVNVLLASGSTLYAACPMYGVFKSTDGGANWADASAGLPLFSYIQALCVRGTTLYAGLYLDGIYKSTDNGASWNATNGGLSNPDVLTFAVAGPVVVAGTHGGGFFVSTDNGVSWKEKNTSETQDCIVYSMAVDGTTVAAGTQRGVFTTSNNGDTWTATNNGLRNVSTTALLRVSSGRLFAACYGPGIFRSYDGGATWSAANTGLGDRWTNALAEINGTVYAGTDGDGVYASTDGGDTWSETPDAQSIGVVYSLATQGNRMCAGTEAGVFVSTDAGASWIPRQTGISKRSVHGLEMCGDTLFAATDSGLFRSVDLGKSWTNLSGSFPDVPQCLSIRHIGDKLYLGLAHNGAWGSTDGGTTWSLETGGPPAHISVFCFLEFFNEYGHGIFLGSNNAAYVRTDRSGWTRDRVNSGLPDPSLIDAFAQPSSSIILVGSDGMGVWRRPLFEIISSADDPSALPIHLAVDAYPNPVITSNGGGITLSVRSACAGRVDVRVFDALGCEVAQRAVEAVQGSSVPLALFTGGWNAGTYRAVVRSGDRTTNVGFVIVY